MKILILHRIPYHKIQYHRGIDHNIHEVTYAGTKAALANIPANLNCKQIIRQGIQSASEELINYFSQNTRDETIFDKVISLSEYELIDAAKIRDALAIGGPTVEDILLVRDKVLMKKAINEANIQTPKFRKAEEILNSPMPFWHGRTVLKPVDGASSENVYVFNLYLECFNFLKHQQEVDPKFQLNRFQVEEFIEGPILHIDGLVIEGNIVCWMPSQYLGTCLAYAQGKPLGSVQIQPTHKIEQFTKHVIQALNIKQGSFHLEAIQSEEGLVFLEIANRVGGADVVDTFNLATGVYLPAAELSSLVGDVHLYDTMKVLNISSEKFGWFVFPGHHLPNGLAQIFGLDEFRNHASVVRLNELSDGLLPRNITYQSVEVPIAGIVKGTNSQELFDWISTLFAKVTVESSPSNFNLDN